MLFSVALRTSITVTPAPSRGPATQAYDRSHWIPGLRPGRQLEGSPQHPLLRSRRNHRLLSPSPAPPRNFARVCFKPGFTVSRFALRLRSPL